jgi:hypothetical protein
MDKESSLALLSQIRSRSSRQKSNPSLPGTEPAATPGSEKSANDLGTALSDHASQIVKGEALSDLAKLTLFGLGAGVAGRGTMGLMRLMHRNVSEPTTAPPRYMTVPVPFPAKDEEKAANFLAGDQASTPEGVPWHMPAMFTGTLLGGIAGWKGLDSILDARRKTELDAEEAEAKSRFEAALLSQYDRPRRSSSPPIKRAAEEAMEKLGQDLDALFDLFEKLAFLGISPDTLGSLAGGYGTYAVPASLLAGYATYEAARKTQRRAVLDKAIKERRRRQRSSSPTELVAMPMPVAS